MANRALAVLLLATFAVAALSQTYNCDQARGLGTPGSNQCARLCATVAERAPALATRINFCNTQCGACVADVQKCAQGAKQPLPQTCQTAFKFPQVLAVVNECLAARAAGKAC